MQRTLLPLFCLLTTLACQGGYVLGEVQSGNPGGAASGADGNAGSSNCSPGCSAVTTAAAGTSVVTTTAGAGTSSRGACSGTLLLGTAPGIALPDTETNYDSTARIALFDFDGDAKLDVLAVDQGRGSTVLRLYHREAGLKFGVGVELNRVTPGPQDVVARDFTGDGKIDVAIADNSSVQLLRQGAASAFESAGSFPVPFQADRIATGDLNRDGRGDLVVATLAGDSLSVLFAQPNGGFATRVDYATGFQGMYRAAAAPIVADFNGDGYGDIAVADPPSGVLSVLFSDASGPFATHVDATVGSLPRGLAAADFDGDGMLDLATSGDGTVSVLRNRGGGTFDSAREYSVTGAFTWLGSADLNEDGVPDLVTVGDGVAVLLGRGDGTFEDPTKHGSGKFGSAAISDLDGDGHLDLVATQVGVVVLLGDGHGGFVEPSPGISVGSDSGGIDAWDVNRDGLLDLVVTNTGTTTPSNDTGDSFAVLLGDGTGRFTRQPTPSGALLRQNFETLVDFDNDGLLDGIATDETGRISTVFPGQSDGTFKSGPPSSPEYESYDWHAADVNADGYLDLVYLTYNSLVIALNDGRGHFLKPTAYQLLDLLGSVMRVDIADHDGDGILDAAVLVHEPDALRLYKGDGTGAFTVRSTVTLPDWPNGVSSGDLNGDGLIDFAVTDSYGASGGGLTSVLLAQPDGSYETTNIDLQVGSISDVRLLDMNGDHVLDILTWFRYGISVALGVGDGTFQTPALPYQVGTLPYQVGTLTNGPPIADFNRDGAPDLAFGSQDSVTILLNGCKN
jgi:hypothetical protein